MVRGQDWKSLRPHRLGQWEPGLRVTVVLPARDGQDQLDLVLAALSRQTYPSELLDVVVVDDASTPALRLPDRRPDHTELISLGEAQSHGSGRARHAGAMHTDADVVLFLDADVVPEHQHVEAHARWHHLTHRAVVLGRKWFVDFAGITPEQVQDRASAGRVLSLLKGRSPKRHTWQEDYIAGQEDLTQDTDDAFVAVVGATVSLRRDLYLRSGGFASFGLRGIVDTEFGYRVYTSGGLIVPDHEARAYHQGPRSFDSRGDEVKRLRTGLAANYLPIPLFRLSSVGRQWAVPMLRVVVEARTAPSEAVQITVDSILASDLSDLSITVAGQPPGWLRDYFAHEGRVEFSDEPPASGFPSPLTCAVSAGVLLASDTLRSAVRMLAYLDVGALQTHPGGMAGLGLQLWQTRFLLRESRSLQDSPDDIRGLSWVYADDLGIARARVGVTKQGMIFGDLASRQG